MQYYVDCLSPKPELCIILAIRKVLEEKKRISLAHSQIFQKNVFEFAYEVTVWNSSVMSKHSALTQASRIFGVSLNTHQEE